MGVKPILKESGPFATALTAAQAGSLENSALHFKSDADRNIRTKPNPLAPNVSNDTAYTNDMAILDVAIKDCDSRIMYALFFALDIKGDLDDFDYSHRIPAENGLPFKLDMENIEIREPERFSPAAMGLLKYHNYVGVRAVMCVFMKAGEYAKLSPNEKTIFRRMWKIIEAELKDGDKLISYYIRHQDSKEFKEFEATLKIQGDK